MRRKTESEIKVCRYCNKKPATTKGLCIACYARYNRNLKAGFDTIDYLKKGKPTKKDLKKIGIHERQKERAEQFVNTLNDSRFDRMKEMYISGMSYGDIAKVEKLSRERVSQILHGTHGKTKKTQIPNA